MFTLFAIPKPFSGHFGVIQRNALRSWTLIRPACEILLFGTEEGTAETAAELGIRHVPQVARNEFGTPILSDLFDQAQRIAVHPALCYVNADIMLLSDFARSMDAVSRRLDRFLMIGRRWDFDLREPWDFAAADWEQNLIKAVRATGDLHEAVGIDYFAFTRGLWGTIPPFAIGRLVWDNWMVYGALRRRSPVVDATEGITCIHQNHDYNHHPGGRAGVWQGPEAMRNIAMAGRKACYYGMDDATWKLTANGGWRRNRTRPAYRRWIGIPYAEAVHHFLEFKHRVRIGCDRALGRAEG